jgi:uncharacterized protein HemX
MPVTGQARSTDTMNFGLVALLVTAVLAIGAGFTLRARTQGPK